MLHHFQSVHVPVTMEVVATPVEIQAMEQNAAVPEVIT